MALKYPQVSAFMGTCCFSQPLGPAPKRDTALHVAPGIPAARVAAGLEAPLYVRHSPVTKPAAHQMLTVEPLTPIRGSTVSIW